MAEKGQESVGLQPTVNQDSDTVFDFHCDLCIKDDKYMEANGYCSDCKEYLCKECYNTHLKPKPLQHHVLLDQHSMPRTTSKKQSMDICSEPCAEHKHETLMYYCANHNKFGCSVCMTLHHRTCEGVDYIPDIAADVLASREYKDMNKRVKNMTKTAKQVKKLTQQKTETSDQQHFNASEFFRQLKENLIATVDRLETLTMSHAENIRDENEKKMSSVEGQGVQLLKDIEALDSKFTSLENEGQHCQTFLSMKRSQDEIASLETSVLQLQDPSNYNITEYAIKMNDDLQNLIKPPEN